MKKLFALSLILLLFLCTTFSIKKDALDYGIFVSPELRIFGSSDVLFGVRTATIINGFGVGPFGFMSPDLRAGYWGLEFNYSFRPLDYISFTAKSLFGGGTRSNYAFDSRLVPGLYFEPGADFVFDLTPNIKLGFSVNYLFVIDNFKVDEDNPRKPVEGFSFGLFVRIGEY